MIKHPKFLTHTLVSLGLFVFFFLVSSAFTEMSQIVNVTQAIVPDPSPVSFLNWLSNHWTTVALISSEIAAFLPSKVNGIIQGIITGLSAIFHPKK